MRLGVPAPATLPPPGLPGIDPAWSRLVTVPHLDRSGRTFHVLDTGPTDAEVTLLCVHGNPSWSYLWREVLAGAPAGRRVIAPDQLDMGFSERTGTVRRLATRIDDLTALTDELELDGPVVVVAHDWGGPISLGWAQRHRSRVAGLVLTNTAVHQPEGAPAPSLIRLARSPLLLDSVAVDTPVFVRAAIEMSRPRPPAAVRDAYLAPYRSADRRAAVAAFVADIPLEPHHPSAPALDAVASGLEVFTDVPSLLLWGASDPVFSDRYLHDLESRLPHADVHRFADARHYVPEDADVAGALHAWLDARAVGADSVPGTEPTTQVEGSTFDPLWSRLEGRAGDDSVAVVEMGAQERSITFSELAADVRRVAAGMRADGIARGDRVALLIPPGIDLTVCLYACWTMGAVPVIVDAGLGPRGIGRALSSAAPDHLVGIPKALAAARAMRWPGRRIVAGSESGVADALLGSSTSIESLRSLGVGLPAPPHPGPDDLAAIVFTSGATGPAKGVRYRHRQASAQRDALMSTYGIVPDDRFVAAFAPFALFGPAMGIASVVPDMEVTAPGTLTASALADAVAAIDATLVFASPAALANVHATARELDRGARSALQGVRLLMSAGAPVAPVVLEEAVRLMPSAEAHTPYGMTEVLPVADIDLDSIVAAGPGPGVCVGRPVPGVSVMIDPLDELGRPVGEPTVDAEVTGEILIEAAHARDGYDRLWMTEHRASRPTGWHRSGDVGHLDPDGRLWIEGRLVHVIRAERGPVTPVAVEHAARAVDGVTLAAAVGVGPAGAQQLVVVIVTSDPPTTPALADPDLADRVRAAVGLDVAAVLVVSELPVDHRHNSKIDRTRVADWASDVLAGGRMRRL